MRIEFNREKHEYTVDGVLVKSVTQILKEYGLVPQFFSQQAATRGTYVHRAVELYLRDNLDEESLDPVIKPYFQSFKSFWEKQEADTWQMEEAVGSLLWGIAGRIDWFGNLNGETTVVDFKTGQKVYDSAWLQLNLYRRLLESGSEIYKYKTKVLHITPDKAELVEQDEEGRKRTEKVVSAILTLEFWKRRKK